MIDEPQAPEPEEAAEAASPAGTMEVEEHIADEAREEAPDVETAEPEPEPEPEVDPQAEEIAALKAELDLVRRQAAARINQANEEVRIARRQTERAREDLEYAAKPLAEGLMPTLDSFERALQHLEDGASPEKVIEGIRATDRLMRNSLKEAGLERIAALGAPFDPDLHEGLATVETDEYDEDTVVDEIEAGYTYKGRVIRAAKVRVSKKP